jgi:hypothetical protein
MRQGETRGKLRNVESREGEIPNISLHLAIVSLYNELRRQSLQSNVVTPDSGAGKDRSCPKYHGKTGVSVDSRSMGIGD